jgi:hypothetical protein
MDPSSYFEQGCQMAYFQTKNPNLGKFWSVLQWKTLEYLRANFADFMVIGIFFPILVCCTKINLATLVCFGFSAAADLLA